VEGDGRLQQIQTTVPDGVSATILNFPGIGSYLADCGNGQSTTHFINTAGGNVHVTQWGVVAGAVEPATIASSDQAPGGASDQPSGTGGVSGTTWLAYFTDPARLHLVKIEAVTRAVGIDCEVTAQAIRTG
jgi:hypothetical protein